MFSQVCCMLWVCRDWYIVVGGLPFDAAVNPAAPTGSIQSHSARVTHVWQRRILNGIHEASLCRDDSL